MMLFAQSGVYPYASYFKSSNTESENEIFKGYLINITNAQLCVTLWWPFGFGCAVVAECVHRNGPFRACMGLLAGRCMRGRLF